jgi:hypothetical protein
MRPGSIAGMKLNGKGRLEHYIAVPKEQAGTEKPPDRNCTICFRAMIA